MSERTLVIVRVELPDRPGALGLVASRIGAARGDIVGVEILETDGRAVDEFSVVLPSEAIREVMVREVQEVDGTRVVEVRTVPAHHDPHVQTLGVANLLVESQTLDQLQTRLVEIALTGCQWSALVHDDEVLAGAGSAAVASGALASIAAGADPNDGFVARGALPTHNAIWVLGRTEQQFARREHAVIGALARIADRCWTLLE
jgi:hypothetical protein